MDDDHRSPCSWPIVGGVAALICILPFLAVVVDELVLRTFVLCEAMNETTASLFEVLYWPLLRLLGVR